MSDYKIQNIKYSIASNLYDKQSKAIQKNEIVEVKDLISINSQQKDFGGVEVGQKASPDILGKADTIVTSSRSENGFFKTLQEKFLNQIIKSERVSSSPEEVNLVELTAAIGEAEIAVQQITQVRDKIVSAYKEIINSAF